ncbi:putative short chain dehydrogenase/ reductase [Cucurbitaria berberidis CBS 394.84]|uniref:Short chain dehydrogenase/ reductase n=1 Tax=Cucurbitaria berberidis CBS 394.84 TaxID=1168544 RepID=A0A9P4G6Y3_9PLEO|nr:putative short chain dehydrogenase/ reductase [Cucurbitaria berberidis CBS 394.84]KAF1840166.1 putative short chain dehydrogenase/ reductase [Cucurbitaria berberidis CBS 394.84]
MSARQPGLNDQSTTSQPYSVKGKSAIVTGAGSGINFSFATLLLSKGCNVLIADLSLRPEAQALLDTYSSKRDTSSNQQPRAVYVKTDVTNWPQLERMFRVGIEEFGVIDIVCPGAGIYDPHWSNFWHPPGALGGKSRDTTDGGRYTTLDINITHPIRTTQLALSHFLNPPTVSPPGSSSAVQKASPQNPKRVILISSIAGQNANLNTPLYVAAKHAMNGFIRSLGKLEEKIGVRVNGVAPGVIKTPLWTEHPEKMTFLDEGRDQWATAEEVADAMLRCLEEPGLGGGTILEVGARQTRLVEALNDPGPSGAGHTVSNLEEQYSEVYEWLGQEGWGVGKVKL